MPISWPRMATWQIVLVLAVVCVGFITLSKTASGCVVRRGPDGRQLPSNFFEIRVDDRGLAKNFPMMSTCGTPTPSPTPTPTPLRYEVEPGVTIFDIAKRYDVTVDDLVRVNRLVNPADLQVGQSLIIPPPTPIQTPIPTPIQTPKATAPPSFCPGAISWHEANQHVGTQKSVKGPVAEPTFGLNIIPNPGNVLDLGRPYPHHTFSVVISFENPRDLSPYRGQFICVTGLIKPIESGRSFIEATAASQIVIYSPVSQPPFPTPASNDPWGTTIPIIIGTLVWLLCFAGLIVFARRR